MKHTKIMILASFVVTLGILFAAGLIVTSAIENAISDTRDKGEQAEFSDVGEVGEA